MKNLNIFLQQTRERSKSILSFVCIFLILLLFACKSSKNSSSASSNRSDKNKNVEVKKSESGKVKQLIKAAKSYTGTRYKYGGTSRAGIDCSGLTSLSFKEIGVSLPRTANEQSTLGKKIPLDELKEGDLVFFTDKKGHNKITHVGIVTDVRSKTEVRFIHASTKLGVVEADLFADYYKPLILKAVRIL